MNKTTTISYFKTLYWELILGSFDNKLCLCDWKYRKMRASIDKRIMQWLDAEYVEWNSWVIEETKKQLLEYSAWKRKIFDIELCLVGTVFQKQVWKELIRIPFWKTFSYLDLSKKIWNEKAIRAVASANWANAISIIIPCHRIIGSDGSLIWYAWWLPAKQKLLQWESEKIQKTLFE